MEGVFRQIKTDIQGIHRHFPKMLSFHLVLNFNRRPTRHSLLVHWLAFLSHIFWFNNAQGDTATAFLGIFAIFSHLAVQAEVNTRLEGARKSEDSTI